MSQVKTFDPKEVQVVFGEAILSGFAEGSMVTAERDADSWSKYTGVDGEIARAKSNNRAGSVTVRLSQTSSSNDVLSSIMVEDEVANAGMRPIMIKDGLGTTLIASEYAWIRKPPAVEEGGEIGEREWIFDTGEMDIFVGGN